MYHLGFGGSSLHFQAAHAGQDLIRPLWKHYFLGSHAMIFVVDSCWAKAAEIQSQMHQMEWEDLPTSISLCSCWRYFHLPCRPFAFLWTIYYLSIS